MNIIIVGSGISGLSAAIQSAQNGMNVTLLSPYPSERAQSVMAAGGFNAVVGPDDSVDSHAEDTYAAGRFIENKKELEEFCKCAPDNLKWIANMGVVFNRDENHNICVRAFGGQSHKRTAYSGASTGKQIVTGLVQKCREMEIKGLVQRKIGLYFHSALIKDGKCYGVLALNSDTGEIQPFYADAVVIACGGQNKLFGKTTGTENCDGYVAARLFTQGVRLRNLEFIQYHPTTIETSQKRMLITEAARGEGGRLYYLENGNRRYFMEELYGEKGNLMPRDVVSKCIYDCSSQVYLDIAFLGEKLIYESLREVYDLCKKYINIDVTKESIPVAPSVHFFMGGIDVDSWHESNVERLFAVGECASKYHGANRLGGNSMLAAVHSGRVAASRIKEKYGNMSDDKVKAADISKLFADDIKADEEAIGKLKKSESTFPAQLVLNKIADIMNKNLGITRCEEEIIDGISNIEALTEFVDKNNFEPQMSIYEVNRLKYLAVLAKAILLSAMARKETRGAHIRSDFPETSDEFKMCSLAEYADGEIKISFRDENLVLAGRECNEN